MDFTLKNYQRRCLEELKQYLRRAVELGRADTAFQEQTDRSYRDVKALPGLPYVCVRVPTGGGKTVLAAHSVGVAARELLRAERCIALWLAPTTQIVEQTLKMLQDKRHPCRQALDEAFGGAVTVMDIGAAFTIQRSTVVSDTVIIVSTMAALRVENTDGRRIYDESGTLMSHFDGLTEAQKAGLLKENGADGPVVKSLANLLRLHRPLVVVDEAHNARTGLSFGTLARFSPSCILEFTATPDQNPKGDPSNVLTHVSAAELKAEEMIKLPILLKTREQWVEAVQEALARQSELERLAKAEEVEDKKYIRPIVLFQAQRQYKGEETISYEVLRKALIEEFKVPEEQIAIATGGENELAGLDVLARECPVRFIITVDKLREGWDCPFAYVLCSISNLTSATAVEQILGRILRLPYAKKKAREELNKAYAYVTSGEFKEAADTLRDALVDSGFEQFEAQSFVKPAEPLPGTLIPPTVTVSREMTAAPAIEKLPPEIRKRIKVTPSGDKVKVTYTGLPLLRSEENAILGAFEVHEDKVAAGMLCQQTREEVLSPAARKIPFRVPRLAFTGEGQPDLFEDQFLETTGKWPDRAAILSEEEFCLEQGPARVVAVDISKQGKVEYSPFIETLTQQLALLDERGPKTEGEMVRWLDRVIPHPELTQPEAHRLLAAVVSNLTGERGYTLEQIVRNRFRLRDALEVKLKGLRQAAAAQAYQQLLFPETASRIETTPAVAFSYPFEYYPATSYYQGEFQFRKHYYEKPGAMNDQEATCAHFLDTLPEVKHWARNIERQETHSFWLPTATDKFYPDFVAELLDGRYLVVEYKGAHLIDAPDAKEKKLLGELWEARSDGMCIFRMVTEKGMEANLRKAVTA